MRPLTLAYAIAFTCLTLLTGCQDSEPVADQKRIRPVKTEVVSTEAKNVVRRFAGGAQAAINSRLSFRITGVLDSVDVQVGQVINKGEVLASINSEDLKAKLAADESALVNAQAQEQAAFSQFERIQNLFEQKMVSRVDFDNVKASWQSAKNATLQALSARDLSRKQVGYATLRAPADDCTVSELHAQNNETVSAGQVIVTVSCGRSMEVLVTVPESVISHIQVNDNVTIDFPSVKKRGIAGRVSEIGDSTNQNSAYPVTIAVDTSSAYLRSGMAAEVAFTFKLGTASNSLWVPLSALGKDGDSEFVYLFEGQSGEIGRVKKQPVSVGGFTLDSAEIISGLEAGNSVIVAGRSQVYEGLAVKELTSSTAREQE